MSPSNDTGLEKWIRKWFSKWIRSSCLRVSEFIINIFPGSILVALVRQRKILWVQESLDLCRSITHTDFQGTCFSGEVFFTEGGHLWPSKPMKFWITRAWGTFVGILELHKGWRSSKEEIANYFSCRSDCIPFYVWESRSWNYVLRWWNVSMTACVS